MNTRLSWLLPAFALALAGCAAPNTPGAGAGADYTPVIDTEGLDMSRYEQDLAACRRLAKSVDPANEAIGAAVIGALIGGALASAAGGGSQTQLNTANYGGLVGGSTAMGGAIRQQKSMVINCMVGRGYRALEVPLPLGASLSQQQASSGARVASSSGGASKKAEAPAAKIGPESHQIERLDEVRACADLPVAQLLGRGTGGVETYAVNCRGGDTLTFRCNFGVCRKLE